LPHSLLSNYHFARLRIKISAACDGFFTMSLYPRYRIRILTIFWFLSNFSFISSIRRVRQDFSTTYDDFKGSIFQLCEMASCIRAVRKQNAIRIFCLPNSKSPLCVFSLCAKWVKSCLNPVNISTTWNKFKIVSFYPR
jgi:hypothetical protein